MLTCPIRMMGKQRHLAQNQSLPELRTGSGDGPVNTAYANTWTDSTSTYKDAGLPVSKVQARAASP